MIDYTGEKILDLNLNYNDLINKHKYFVYNISQLEGRILIETDDLNIVNEFISADRCSLTLHGVKVGDYLLDSDKSIHKHDDDIIKLIGKIREA